MSHEGIRFVSAEQAHAESQHDDKLPVDAVTPLRVRVKKSDRKSVV